MKKKIGFLFMSLGTLLLVGAMSLLLWNQNESRKAKETANEIFEQMIEEIEKTEKIVPKNPYEEDMSEKIIEGHAYIGYLQIPSLGLQLPVMADWDYSKLRIAPCRYYGSIATDDFVIAAHNYVSHFGKLKEINIGDEVFFINMNGKAKQYRVDEVNVLEATAVEDMTNGEFELRLFTCTYGGKSRLTIGCSEIM